MRLEDLKNEKLLKDAFALSLEHVFDAWIEPPTMEMNIEDDTILYEFKHCSNDEALLMRIEDEFMTFLIGYELGLAASKSEKP